MNFTRQLQTFYGYRERTGPVRASTIIPVFLLGLLIGNAAIANDKPFRATYAGSVSTTEIDLNADEEETARTSQGVGVGSLIGPFVFHEIRESDLLEPTHPDNSCPEGQIEMIEVHWTIVMTDQIGANQLFFRVKPDQSSDICLDPQSPPTGGDTRKHDFKVIGGSGRFEDASGEVTVQCNGYPLAPGVAGAGPAHGAVSCTMSGSIDF